MAYNKDDVVKVATALLDEHSTIGTGDQDYNERGCDYCSAWGFNITEGDLVHDLDCPILVARDLLA